MTRDRGTILLNALVLVMAMAAMAGGLLSLAVQGATRLADIRETDQAQLYLDAGEALAAQVLKQDWEDNANIDDLGELWATEGYLVPIDRGTLAAGLADLQGRFNVNRLSQTDDPLASGDLDRLMRALGLDAQIGAALTDFMREGGPLNPAPYVNRDLPVRVRGGRVPTTAALRAVAGMTPEIFARLEPFIAALPTQTTLNLNTAPAPVLAAYLPGLGNRDAETVLALRRDTPFDDVGSFARRTQTELRRDIMQGMNTDRFSVASEWFAANLEVDLAGMRRRRTVTFHRPASSGDVARTYGSALP